MRPGDGDLNDWLQENCPQCHADADRAAALTEWEDTPLDPDDDLSFLVEYPAEQARLRAEQDEVRAHPGYVIANRLGEPFRTGFLRAIDQGPDAAEQFYADHICQCRDLGDEFADGSPVRRRHRKAARCIWCDVWAAIEHERHAAVSAQVQAEFERYGSMGLAS